MTQPTILNIQMTEPGLVLVIGALRKLPHEQVDDLVRELWQQYQLEIARDRLAAKAEAQQNEDTWAAEQAEAIRQAGSSE